MTLWKTLSARVPWWGKLSAKILLARIPFSYRTWQKLGLFRHGAMTNPSYAWNVYSSHLMRFQTLTGREFPEFALELGPGDSPFSGAFGAALGTRKTFLVDGGAFLRWDPETRASLKAYLKQQQLHLDFPDNGDLECLRTTYLTEGLDSLRSLPDASVDFIWSQAVLEHLPRKQFSAFQTEMRRLLRHDGCVSHRVDLKDHLGGALNNLRFSESTWESYLFQHSGFYTNRLRRSEMLEAFRAAGLDLTILEEDHWMELPTPRERFDDAFRALSDEDLNVSGFNIGLLPDKRHT